MAYRADFYIPQNIIGFTGDVNNNPTVYLKTGPAFGPNEYGHITQGHGVGPNVGREEVHRSAKYEMRVGARGNLEEWDGGQCFHRSRSGFIPVEGLSSKSKFLLGCSIANFTEKKRIGRFRGELDQLLDDDQVEWSSGQWGLKDLERSLNS